MTEEVPLVSIATPSYNQAQFLKETILSVLSQDHPKLQYIIIDGAPTDGGVDIIRKYDVSLAHWVSEPHRGQSHAVNEGILASMGETIGCLDLDGIHHPNAATALLPLVILGALPGRTPFVSSDSGDVRDHARSGEVTRTSEAIARTISALLNDHERRSRLAEDAPPH